MKNRYEVRGKVTTIYIKRKNGDPLETTIDTDDLEKANAFPNTWCALWSSITRSFYCYGKLNVSKGKRATVLLHRWITDCPDNMQVDHYDNNTLNNCRGQNLRITSCAQNQQNRTGAQKNSGSGVRGVSWNVRRQKWQAGVKVRNNRLFLGYFDTKDKADAAVKCARQTYMPFSKEAAL